MTPITTGAAFDPQTEKISFIKSTFDPEEFRGSYGLKWTDGEIQGAIVSFKAGDGVCGILVYAIGPTQDINGFYRDAITVMDPNVGQNNLSAAIMDASTGSGNGEVQGCNLPLMSYAKLDDGNESGVSVGSYDYSQADTSVATETSDENADQTGGWAIMALEVYGKQVYSYGVELHMILGVQLANHTNPDVWEFQITCDVTNEYGATAKDQVCNATVNLIDGAWQVTDFSVH